MLSFFILVGIPAPCLWNTCKEVVIFDEHHSWNKNIQVLILSISIWTDTYNPEQPQFDRLPVWMRLGTSRPPVPPMGYNPAVLRPRELVSVTPGQPRLPPPLPPPQLIVQGMWSLEPRKLGRGVGGQKKREGGRERERERDCLENILTKWVRNTILGEGRQQTRMETSTRNWEHFSQQVNFVGCNFLDFFSNGIFLGIKLHDFWKNHNQL